jgi:vacuolar-type H+-ATPase subunit B/Vma2
MRVEYTGTASMSGSILVVDGITGVGYDEMAEFYLDNGTKTVRPRDCH